MADLNAIYGPASDYTDPDQIIGQRPGGLFGTNPIDIYYPDELRDRLRQINAAAVSTADAVKVPYNGSTQQNRNTWLVERIKAVDVRLNFVKDRTLQLLNALKDRDISAYNSLLKAFSAAIGSVPVVGQLVSVIVGNDQAAQAVALVELQTKIKDYQTDAEQLIKIRQSLVTEYSTATGETIDEAPKVIPTYYYFIAGGILIILFALIMKRRSNSRSNRRR